MCVCEYIINTAWYSNGLALAILWQYIAELIVPIVEKKRTPTPTTLVPTKTWATARLLDFNRPTRYIRDVEIARATTQRDYREQKVSRRPATRFVSYYRCTFLGPSAGIRRTQLKIASARRLRLAFFCHSVARDKSRSIKNYART